VEQRIRTSSEAHTVDEVVAVDFDADSSPVRKYAGIRPIRAEGRGNVDGIGDTSRGWGLRSGASLTAIYLSIYLSIYLVKAACL